MEEEDQEPKRTSKLTALIGQAKEEINGMQIFVHYSENNWETNEEINLILDENSTINQMVQAAKEQLKDKYKIDNKTFFVRIFKKKKKIPNEEYPICNFESKIKDYAKSHFCLVENEYAVKKDEEKEEEKKEEIEKKQIKKSEKKIENEKNNSNTENKDDNEKDKKKEKGKGNKQKGKCIIY